MCYFSGDYFAVIINPARLPPLQSRADKNKEQAMVLMWFRRCFCRLLNSV